MLAMESNQPTLSKEDDENKNKEKFMRELSNEYEKRFTSMLSNVKLCSVMLDKEQKIIFINNYLLEQTGYTHEEVMYKEWVSIFIPEEKREQIGKIFSMILNGLTDVFSYVEAEITTKSGERILVGWNNTLLKDVKNNVVGLSSIGETVAGKKAPGTSPLPITQLSNSSSDGDTAKTKLITPGYNFTGETLGNYILVKSLGGDNSNVKLAVHKETKEKVAVKTLKKETMTEQELERAQREVDIMKQLTHLRNPFIIKLLDVIETPQELHIFLEYISGGELVALILRNQGLSESHTHKLFLQILSAIETCHKHSIIHRDIKLQNILLDHNKDIKLIDFGLSNFMEEGVFRMTFCGTPAYASPEILLGTKYTGPEVDVWSLGVVLYAMLTSEFPFVTIGDILKGQFKKPVGVTEECYDLLKKVLRVETDVRETLEGVLNHPWVKMSPDEVEANSLNARNTAAEVGGKIENGEEVEGPSTKKRKMNPTEHDEDRNC